MSGHFGTKLAMYNTLIIAIKSQCSISQSHYFVTLKGSNFNKCFARHLLNKRECQAQSPFTQEFTVGGGVLGEWAQTYR